MFYEGVWRVGIVWHAVFFRTCVASQGRKVGSQKRELRRIGCLRCRRNLHHAVAILKSKSLKTGRFGALFEVEVRKICTAIIQNWRSRNVFGGSNCVSCGRGRDFDTLQNSWQAQGFVLQKRWQAWWVWRVLETILFAWQQAQGFRALGSWCSRPQTLNLWKGRKFHGTEVLLSRDHFASQLQEFVCLGSTFSRQAQHF